MYIQVHEPVGSVWKCSGTLLYSQVHSELDIMKVNNKNPDQIQIKQNPHT